MASSWVGIVLAAAQWVFATGPDSELDVERRHDIQHSEISDPWRLDALLVTTSIKFHATDQRDKVYGLLGLAVESQDPGGLPEALRPDYGLDVAQVYLKVASFILWEYSTLSAMTRTSGVASDVSRIQRKHNFKLLPSWVPDWCDFTVVQREAAKGLSWLSYSNTADMTTLGFPEHYCAAASLPTKLMASPDPSVLRLSGLIVDTVVTAVQFNDEAQPVVGNAHQPQALPSLEAAVPLLHEKTAMDWICAYIKATTVEQYRLFGSTAEQTLKDGSAFLLDLLSNDQYREQCSISHSERQDIITLLREMSVGGDPES
jgi:hypothetical protein